MIHCNLHKRFTNKHNAFDLRIKACFEMHAINVIFGPSGAGKTTLLRIISGLEKACYGSLKFNNTRWLDADKQLFVPPSKRNIAYVFQDFGLFPNMTVLQNLKFVKKELNQNLLEDIISTLEIQNLLQQKPSELSGGQKQRVALARALAQEPELLLLDEPLTSLDEALRCKLQKYLVKLQQRYRFTVILVSHNLEEVLKVADRVCVLENGTVSLQGAPTLLLAHNPKNTLQGTVLEINNHTVCILIGTQKITVQKEQIVDAHYQKGSSITLQLPPTP
ncbi:ATP-binding cassette domain-containing protein [Ochrovirga pacifica]|uniref:ATP-binding cassette domain-containing protein n=1 Tax=Ochrovirga pacifica TaxID=1042376 RepID=UPI000255878B|nr:ATP-binding cassette domain-containing protein [Ochrovirga pacifica]